MYLGGKSRRDYDTFLPPKSFLNAEDFEDLEHLAAFVTFLGENERFYLRLQQWRTVFEVLNEHGYFMSETRHFCRVCEALNYNDYEVKYYDKLDEFWNSVLDCRLRERKKKDLKKLQDPLATQDAKSPITVT